MSEHANHATGHGHATPAHSDAQPSPATQAINVRLRPLPGLIFASRWLQLPLYLGLIVAQAVYVQHFLIFWSTRPVCPTSILIKFSIIDIENSIM